MQRFSRTQDVWLAFLLVVLVSFAWCTHYDRWTRAAWKTPLIYGGDAWGGLAAARAVATGDITVILPKHPHHLGAPFDANWNDYPTVEEGILGWMGLLARLFGLFPGVNLAVLSAHLLAALSFFLVCRHLRYDRLLSAAASLLFSLSTYSFWRGLPHIVLTYYWHVPLGFLVVWWCWSDRELANNPKRLAVCAAVAVLFGIQNPYYTGMFLQLLLWVAILGAFQKRNWNAVLIPIAIGTVLVGTFLAMNIDTFWYRYRAGPNPEVVVRSYGALEQFALKPIDLLLPVKHPVAAISEFVQTKYIAQTAFHGEGASAYLGLIGIAAGFLLVLKTARAVATSRTDLIPWHFWVLLWIVVYSVVGGVNGVVGLLGIVLFRGGNRYSIFVLALLLLFLARELTAFTRRQGWSTGRISLLATAIAAIGVVDQIPSTKTVWGVAATRAQVVGDAKLVSRMEQSLPDDSMVFQLPVMGFPEVAPILGVADYEQLRPYLYSKHLRFSYGSDKGRYRERWQKEIGLLEPPAQVELLERYGFSAILINRKGYEDHAQSFITGTLSVPGTKVIAVTPEFTCISLIPAAQPVLPPEFAQGWHDLEADAGQTHRWSSGDARLILCQGDASPRNVHVRFDLRTLKERRIEIVSSNGQEIYSAQLVPGVTSTVDFGVTLLPGKNELLFRTDSPGDLAGNGDPRPLAFDVLGFQVVPST